jgi:hypothetical protein
MCVCVCECVCVCVCLRVRVKELSEVDKSSNVLTSKSGVGVCVGERG